MRLTVLGGSAAGGNTGAGCSGFLVDTGKTRLVLDLGPGTLPELRKHTDFRKLDAVVISHLHLDHILDVAALRFALSYNPVRPTSTTRLWMPPNGKAKLARLASALVEDDDPETFFSSVFQIQEYDPDGSLVVGDATITFLPTVHWIPCWAMLVTAQDGKTLGYTADTGPDAPLAAFFRDVDVLISEATEPYKKQPPLPTRFHLNAAESARIATEANAKTLVLSHMWEENGFDQYRKAAETNYSGKIVLARPGAMVEW